ncbi:MAG: hypothetical protein WDZ80_02050 [Candidatus Paceibacterota bacterium]
MKAPLIAILFISFITTSCAKVYYSPDAEILADNQKIVAISPPVVSISANKRVEAEAMIEQQRTESANFQNEIYSWMLRRKTQGRITQEFQEIGNTNIYLTRAGFPEKPLTSQEMCESLNVDGLLMSNFALSKPMSDGAAIALTFLVGFGGSTNEVRTTLTIYDCTAQKMIWNYEHKYSGGIGSSPSRLVDQLMKKASRKMPYIDY